jgi:hypothetical protein
MPTPSQYLFNSFVGIFKGRGIIAVQLVVMQWFPV